MDFDPDSDDEEVLLPYAEPHPIMINLLNYEDPLMMSPLIRAIQADDERSAVCFIRAERYLTSYDNNNSTPLHYAVQEGNLVIIDLLLQSPKVDKDLQNLIGLSALHVAVQYSSHVVVKHLLEASCDVNTSSNMGQTPLHLAVIRKSVSIAQELLKAGADTDYQDFNSFTALHQAVENNDLETVCMLLYYNADVSIPCSNGLTAFMHAVNDSDKVQVARALLPYYDDFSAITRDEYTALLLAGNSANPIAVDIIKAGADVNYSSHRGHTILYFSLHYPTAELFNEAWDRSDLESLPNFQVFIHTFFRGCQFEIDEWVQCMYKILNSPLMSLLMETLYMEYTLYNDRLFLNLLISLSSRKVLLDDRLAILTILLSYGTEICNCGMNMVYALFGFNEEFELLVNYADFAQHCSLPVTMFPLAELALGQEPFLAEQEQFLVSQHITLTYIYNKFKVLIPVIYPDDQTYLDYFNYCKRKSVLQAIGHFSLPSFAKQEISSNIFKDYSFKLQLTERLKPLTEFPTLVELARHQIRKNVKRSLKKNTPYYYYKGIKQLQLPKALEDIILFKKPLYP